LFLNQACVSPALCRRIKKMVALGNARASARAQS
jgi:hypothetical protein